MLATSRFHKRFALTLVRQIQNVGVKLRLSIVNNQNAVRERDGSGRAARQCLVCLQFRRDELPTRVAPVLNSAPELRAQSLADKHNRRVLDAAVRTEQALIPDTVYTETTARPIVVLLSVDNKAEVVRLKLECIQILIELPDGSLVLWAVLLLTKPTYLRLNLMRFGVGVSDAIQLVNPSEHLAIGKRDYLVVPSRFVYR